MKRIALIGVLGLVVATGGLVAAQTPAAKPDDHAAHHPDQPAPKAKAKAKPSSSGHGMMGGGAMMGGGMHGDMMGACPGMFGEGAKVEVAKQAKGVTISITSDDPKVIARIQKRAEAMKLMHEANAQ